MLCSPTTSCSLPTSPTSRVFRARGASGCSRCLPYAHASATPRWGTRGILGTHERLFFSLCLHHHLFLHPQRPGRPKLMEQNLSTFSLQTAYNRKHIWVFRIQVLCGHVEETVVFPAPRRRTRSTFSLSPSPSSTCSSLWFGNLSPPFSPPTVFSWRTCITTKELGSSTTVPIPPSPRNRRDERQERKERVWHRWLHHHDKKNK